MSKSLDGYYQETGRAGRDGDDSDCVLFYRGQDASRLSSLVYGDVDGVSKCRLNSDILVVTVNEPN
jgi:ATP-dependent DNA helicase Q1